MVKTRFLPFLSVIFLFVFLVPFSVSLGQEEKTEITLEQLNPTDTYSATLTRKLRLTPEYSLAHKTYHVQQGAAADGTYGYFIMESQHEYKGSIWKVHLDTWEVEKSVYAIDIDHGNDMTYNPKTNQLIVVHNKPNYETLSFIDPDSLTVTDTLTLPFKMYGICYNESRDEYVVGISGEGYRFFVLDKDFKVINEFNGKDTGLVKQGMACDDQFIYFPQNSQDQTVNKIIVYDWSGNYINEIRVKSMQEIESMFFVGGKAIIAFNASGSYIYEAAFFKEN